MKATSLKEPRSDSSANFIAMRDSRNRKLRGLWIRGDRYYLQYRLAGERSARRVPLIKDGRPAANLSEALEARDEILYARRHGASMPARVRKPVLSAAIADYIGHHRLLAAQDEARRRAEEETAAHAPLLNAPKKLSTVRKEELILARWLAHIGDLPLDRIGRPHVTSYLQTILEDGRTRRTRNIHLSIFRNLLRHFTDKGSLLEGALPTVGVKLLRHRTPRRDFLTTDQVRTPIERAETAGGNRPLLADLIKVLAYSGAREMEALRLRWQDVDFESQRLHIGRDGQTSNREPRTVDFLAPISRSILWTCTPEKRRILLGCFRLSNAEIATPRLLAESPQGLVQVPATRGRSSRSASRSPPPLREPLRDVGHRLQDDSPVARASRRRNSRRKDTPRTRKLWPTHSVPNRAHQSFR